MKNLSYIEERSKLILPENTGERVYMLEFFKNKGLPQHLSRWQKTVDQLLEGVDTEGPIYFMVDQGFVKAGNIQRRGGVHIDGYWNPVLSAHDNGNNYVPVDPHSHSPRGHNHAPIPAPSSDPHSHRPRGHNHEPIPTSYPDPHSHSPKGHNHVPNESTRKLRFGGNEMYWPAEGIILASDVQACRAWNGYFDHKEMVGGNCEHVNTNELEEVILKPNMIYAGNVTMLHEALPVITDTYRTVVRLNVPGWNPPSIN